MSRRSFRQETVWRTVLADRSWLVRGLRGLLRLGAMVFLLVPGARAAEEAPDLDFLAYLGSWQENDEEWLAVSEWEGADKEIAQAPPKEQRKDDEKET